ncbi:hypothetical protein [Absidia glauca]|uniref:Uncharacterized protein n=1 Tax=Absidia glauca TaxID=4829 RepID=A0A168KQ30_ABSGL|nr:hypothetical protein [Absidia glauca]
MTSDKAGGHYNTIPPLQLDSNSNTSPPPIPSHNDSTSIHSTVGPQSIPSDASTPRSRSNSISSSASGSMSKREAAMRRISGTMFGLNSPPQQHPPHP